MLFINHVIKVSRLMDLEKNEKIKNTFLTNSIKINHLYSTQKNISYLLCNNKKKIPNSPINLLYNKS